MVFVREENMFDQVEAAIEDLKNGKMIIVTDNEDRENEGDLVATIADITPEKINFMTKYARGLICAPIVEEDASRLGLKPMVSKNEDAFGTNFLTSVDHQQTSTGISAFDRALTIKSLIEPETKATDLNRPGHVFPLLARNGGVLERTGHTEAAVDLSILAGKKPGGVICEILKEDGTMMRRDDLIRFKTEFNLKMINIADLITYRQSQIKADSIVNLPTKFGEFMLHNYVIDGESIQVLVKGEITNNSLVRIHSECLTGDVFHSLRCDCVEQLHLAMAMINEQGGMIFYQHAEGRGIGITNKLRAYALQEQGMDTIEANVAQGLPVDNREYTKIIKILKAMEVNQVQLLTNNPQKIKELEQANIKCTQIPLEIKANKYNQKYLQTKKIKMNHDLKGE